MKASAVERVIAGLKAAGVSVVCYLPDSLFKELYPALDADPDIRTIRVTNEGEGAAICGGVFLSGKLQDYDYPAEKVDEALKSVPKV